MPDTFRVEVPGEEIEDGSGGVYYGEPTTVDYGCRISPVGSGLRDQLLAQQLQAQGTEVIRLPLDADVQVGTEGAWIAADGRTRELRVVGTVDRTYRVEQEFFVSPKGA